MRRLLLALPLLFVSCGTDPAPADLDSIPRWFLLNFETATPAEVAASVATLDAAISDTELPIKNSVSFLQDGDTDAVGKPDADLTKAFGLIAVTSIPCTLAKLEPLLYKLKQDENHPDAYLTYKRTYTTDIEAFKSRKSEFISWDVELSTDPTGLGHEFSEKLKGGMRFLPKVEGAKFGPILLGRTVLQEPAAFKDPDAGFFRQDFQVDVWYERTSGEVVHLFTAWRELKFSIFSVEDLQGSQLKAFVQGDEEKSEFCK